MNDDINTFLMGILQKYQTRDLSQYSLELKNLQTILKSWAGSCGVDIKVSGSRSKSTAISISSDIDVLVSLSANCNRSEGGLKKIYNSLYARLKKHYANVRKQNVSFRILLRDLEVDITPARRHSKSPNYHWLYVSKKDTWQQTNIQKHKTDISQSGRTNEIKLIKIWRELNQLDFPSIYLEYLMINNILTNKSKDIKNLGDNIVHVFSELAKDSDNPLYSRVVDPANSGNILSDLLNQKEKSSLISSAKVALQSNWDQVFY